LVIYNSYFFGAIAQLGERLRGTQEVGGSIPPSSTIQCLIYKLSSQLLTDSVYIFLHGQNMDIFSD
jgi:hypothetical protein